ASVGVATTGDFNSDGNLDLAVIIGVIGNIRVAIRLGNGAGGFSNESTVNAGDAPRMVVAGDFNGDGKLDLAAANYGSNAAGNTVSLRMGNGLGNFSGTTDVLVDSGPAALAMGDFNGDGRLDFATAHNSTNHVSVRLNVCNTPPTITAGPTLTLKRGTTVSDATLATVSDAQTASAQLQVSIGPPSGINISFIRNTAGTISTDLSVACYTESEGEHKIDLQVTDGHGASATTQFTVIVVPNTPPTLSYAAQSMLTGTTLTITPTTGLTDNGSIGSVTHSITPEPASGWIGVDTSGVLTVFDTMAAGAYTVTVRATDYCGAFTDASFTLTVAYPPAVLGTYPNASVATGGSVAVTPSAAPSGTLRVAASTSSIFRGLFTVNPTTGVVRVTNAQPAGTYTVTVKGIGGANTAMRTFTLTVANPTACTNATFANATNVAVGANPVSVAIGDFNLDGKLDFATADSGNNQISIRMGTGSGGFTGTNFLFTFDAPSAVATGDFNGDGKPDLLVTQTSGSTTHLVTVWLGDGAGNFSRGTQVFAANTPESLALGDFNGDDKLDFAAANSGNNTVTLGFGNGAGGFAATTQIGVCMAPRSVTTGDFNRDGKLDFTVACRTDRKVAVRLGDGLGGFSNATDILVDGEPRAVATSDFNGDGKPDLAVASSIVPVPNANRLSIRLGDGLGSFSPASNLVLATIPSGITVGDFNGDGKLDLVIAHSDSNNVSLRLGNGAGGFSDTDLPVSLIPPTAAEGGITVPPLLTVATGDFNRDGKLDLATANSASNAVLITLNHCNTPPTITTSSALVRTQAGAASTATIATVSDAESAAGLLTVTATSVPNGITVTNIVNTNGSIAATVAASCAAAPGANTVVLTVSDGTSTATANLTINVTANPVAIATQPTPRTVTAGANASFTVAATGPLLRYQWRKGGTALNNSVAISGAQTATLVLNGVTAISAGAYDVVITSPCGTVTSSAAALTVTINPASLLVNEFRFSGPNGLNDWYVELYNNTDQPIATNGLKLNWINVSGTQIGMVAFTANRTIPARGYYLIAGAAYSLTHVAPDETVASLGNANWFSGVLLCHAANAVLDAAGATDLLTNGQTQFSEGTPVAALGWVTAEYAWVRKVISGSGSPQDTNNNANDFVLVATASASLNGVTPKLGAPNPQNRTTPVNNARLPMTLLSTSVGTHSAPNFLRDATPLDGTQGVYPLGSFYLRRTITNNTGAAVTKLRAHIVDITDGSVTGQANIRALDAPDITVNGLPVKGVVVNSPPTQPNGGGLNSSMTIRLSEPIQAGGKVTVQFRLGVLSGGSYRFYINFEATN
ncbi:MAG: hypothetical protein HOP19_04785, partial [Acidobacteria bacterium]|nr:hypothetical protein [Acidobacteriota bacterium]